LLIFYILHRHGAKPWRAYTVSYEKGGSYWWISTNVQQIPTNKKRHQSTRYANNNTAITCDPVEFYMLHPMELQQPISNCNCNSSLSGSQRSVNPPQPTQAMNPSVSSFNLGGRKAIANTVSDLGEESPAYKSDPMPEYNYKELKYNLPTTYDGGYHDDNYHDDDILGNSHHDDDYDDKDNSDERNGNGYSDDKNYSNGDHGDERSNGYHSNDSHSNGGHDNEEDYNKSFDSSYGLLPDRSSYQDDTSNAETGSMLSRNGGESLINEIGRKVLWNILQRQQNDENLNGKEIPELLGYDDDSKTSYDGEMTDSLPSHKGKIMNNRENNLPLNQQNTLNNLAKLLATSRQPSSANQKISKILEHFGLTDTQVTQEPQLPLANDLNSKPSGDQTTPSRNIDIGGKLNDVIDVAKVTPSFITIPTSKSTSGVTMTTLTTKASKKENDVTSDSDDVILKISGQGKPVSIKADTSSDGSLLLEIPKKFSQDIIKSNGNQATDNNNSADKSTGLSSDVITLLAGKMGKGSLLDDQPQISDWEVLGKQNKGSKKKQVSINSHY